MEKLEPKTEMMRQKSQGSISRGPTLPETNVFAPENGWLEDFCCFLFGANGLFSGALAVSFMGGQFFWGGIKVVDAKKTMVSFEGGGIQPYQKSCMKFGLVMSPTGSMGLVYLPTFG